MANDITDMFDYDPIIEREPIHWPGGARVAFYVGLNVEHFQVDAASTSLNAAAAGLTPDPLNYGWRDYGPRVGIWRVVDSLDRHGIRASALTNAAVADHYPQIIDAGREREWAWLADGRDNSTLQADMSVDDERSYLTEVVDSIEHATGPRPRGWLGPALTETSTRRTCDQVPRPGPPLRRQPPWHLADDHGRHRRALPGIPGPAPVLPAVETSARGVVRATARAREATVSDTSRTMRCEVGTPNGS